MLHRAICAGADADPCVWVLGRDGDKPGMSREIGKRDGEGKGR